MKKIMLKVMNEQDNSKLNLGGFSQDACSPAFSSSKFEKHKKSFESLFPSSDIISSNTNFVMLRAFDIFIQFDDKFGVSLQVFETTFLRSNFEVMQGDWGYVRFSRAL